MDLRHIPAAIRAAQAGQAEGYKALLAAYGPRLYGYFLRATASHHDAEDLLGELTLRLVQQIKSYDDRGRFEPWLFKIAANMVRDRIRRSKTRPAGTSLSGEDEDGLSLAEKLPSVHTPADAESLGREATAKLNESLDRLDETTRQMILLRHFGQMGFKEIAEMFGCPIGTVLAKVHRGLKALREMLADKHG